MKRFDISIKVLQSELHRIVGKEVWNDIERGISIDFSTKTAKAKGIKRAIDILSSHPENKNV